MYLLLSHLAVSALPDSFDWRDVDGASYISPVRNQLYCGSCYAFASTALHECRLRVMTNNTFRVRHRGMGREDGEEVSL